MGYTVYWNQASYNKFKPEFVEDVKTACQKYTEETNDELDVIAEEDLIKVNSKEEGYEDFIITNSGAKMEFCKTARQPYTLIVKVLLLIAQKYGYVFKLSCDDSYDTDDESWDEAKKFVKKYNLLVFN